MTVTTHRNDGITEIKLDRPETRNAIDGEMIAGLRAAAEAVRADGSCRVVILHGAGPSFCAGLDMANFDDMVSGDLSGDSESVQVGDAKLIFYRAVIATGARAVTPPVEGIE